MIDFKDEIKKFQPVLGIENADSTTQPDEVRDIIDMLQYITQRVAPVKE